MGTNFYLVRSEICAHCQSLTTEKLHVGKSSVGWRFCWQFLEHGTLGLLATSRDWLRAVTEQVGKGALLVDEYGRTWMLVEFKAMVEHKRRHDHQRHSPKRSSNSDSDPDDVLEGVWS